MAKRYYWLKLQNDFFALPRIKKLRKLPNGSDLTIIYLELQLISLKNNGVIYLEGLEDSVEDELEWLIDEESSLIKETLTFLQKYDLLEIINDEELHFVETKMNIGSETDGAERVRQHRKRKQATELLQCNDNVTHMKQDETTCNTEKRREDKIRVDKSIDIELDKEKEIDKDADGKEKEDSKEEKEKPKPFHYITKEHEFYLTTEQIDFLKKCLDNKKIDVEYKINHELKTYLKGHIHEINQHKDLLTFVLYWLKDESNQSELPP